MGSGIQKAMKTIIVVTTQSLIQDAETMPTQKAMAKSYACLIRWKENQAATDVKAVNEAIKKRWGINGLIRIKDMAWKPEKLFAKPCKRTSK